MALIKDDSNERPENKPVVLKKLKFLVGDIVYLRTDPFQSRRIITSIHLNPNGYLYEVTYETQEPSIHYDIELSYDRDEEYMKENFDTDMGED
jgi:hypothetical protein